MLYTNNSATVLSPDGETESFDIKAGILQGDTLAPFLFIMAVDYILRVDGTYARLLVRAKKHFLEASSLGTANLQ